MVIRVKKDPPKKYLFGAEAAAAKAAQKAAVTRKISQDIPPNVQFLRFDSIVGRDRKSVV